MSGKEVELGTLNGVPTVKEDGALEGYVGDEKYATIYKPRGTPREFVCGQGLYCRIALNPIVFFLAVVVIWGFIIWQFADPVSFSAEFNQIAYTTVVNEYSWLYIGSINLFGIFCFYLVFSKMGGIVLAPPTDPEPDFPYYSWFSMLFSAGVGIGLFFFGVWEPIHFYVMPIRDNYNYLLPKCDLTAPIAEQVDCCNWDNPQQCWLPSSRFHRANAAMNIAWFDWGFAASACYVVFGLPLAFYHYRYNMPMSVRSGFYPLIGNRIYGWFGDLVDAFCIIGTIFGVCTSLGLGVTQMVQGMSLMNSGIKGDVDTYVLVICCITAVATLSVVTGLEVGIRRLSEVNFTLGIILLVLVFVMGKPEYFLDLFLQVMGYHFNHLPETSFYGGALERHIPLGAQMPATSAYLDGMTAPKWAYPAGFEASWTIFYWGWWFSWSPFVGTFLARISKGRTVREFVVGNMIVPTLLTSIWFTVFGGTGFVMQYESENLGLDCTTLDLAKVRDKFDYVDSVKKGTCTADFAEWRGNNINKVGPYDLCKLNVHNEPAFINLGCRIATNKDSAYSGGGGRQMLFDALSFYDLADFTIPLSIAGLFTYFITSSDSASQVSDMIASNGDLEPPYWQRVFWSVSEGLLAIILITAGQKDGVVSKNALWAVQAASIAAGFPLVLIMIILTYATYKALRTEQMIIDGETPAVIKQYQLPFPDALVQLVGKCCGIGVFCCQGQESTSPLMQFVNACCSCWCPHLVTLRGLLVTTDSVIWQVLTAIAVIVPWIAMYVFFGMCPAWLQVFDTASDKRYDPDSCDNLGYYALGVAMYLVMIGYVICFRNRVREVYEIEGNGCEDFVMGLFCPQVSVYQAWTQLVEVPQPEKDDSGAEPATTGAVKATGQV